MTTPNQRQVVHHPDGGWAVRKPHAGRVSSRHATQAQAQTRAKEILSHGGGGQAVTFGRDGRIIESDRVDPATIDWSLLSPLGHILFYIALCPDSTTKDIARAVGRTTRQTWSSIRTLKEGGMIRVRKKGRRSHFAIDFDAPFLHPGIDKLTLRTLLEGAVTDMRSTTPDICEEIQAT